MACRITNYNFCHHMITLRWKKARSSKQQLINILCLVNLKKRNLPRMSGRKLDKTYHKHYRQLYLRAESEKQHLK